MRCLPLHSLVALTIACLGTPTVGADSSPLGKQIDGFSLPDYRGKVHSLADYQDSKAVVVAFIGTECPLAKLYGPRLEQLASDYAAAGVTVLAIDSNRQDSMTELAGFAARHGMTFPVLKDPDNRVADQFGAERTPSAYLLDGDGVIRYYGRIDDQYGQHLADNGKRISYAHSEPKRHDLAIALDEVLAGKPVSEPLTEAVGCLIGRVPEVDPQGEVTFTNQIARILNQRCVECHRDGEIAPFALTDYDEVAGWSEMIREVVNEGRMPPWHANPEYGEFQNDCRLSAEETELINAWVDNGSPQGDPADLPEPPQFSSGWTAGEPDQIVYMSDEPYQVSATGTVEYQYYEVDPGWTEDKWIRVAEARPDNRAVVHHILVFVRSPGAGVEGFRDGVGIGWAPGTPPTYFEHDTAMFVPAGSTLVFQLHYTPNGSPQQDRSYVGFQFADPNEVKYMASGAAAMTARFRIPAGAHNYKVESDYVFDRDQLLLGMLPHMHLRGKSFRYTAHYPDGQEEILLDVPSYDFNWQLRYEPKQPKLMPKGTRIHCVAHYDNSADNLSNPDPSIDVTWGDQTWEEMMIGFMTTREVAEIDHEALAKQQAQAKQEAEQMAAKAKMFIAGMDKNGNGTLSVDEVPEQMRGFFERVDMNRDGEIDAQEGSIIVQAMQRRGGFGRRGGGAGRNGDAE